MKNNTYIQLIWKILRYWKPVRTFWMTLATMLPVMSTGIANGDTGLTGVNWVTALSGAASAAIFNFIVLMSTCDSMWSEKKENATMSLLSDSPAAEANNSQSTIEQPTVESTQSDSEQSTPQENSSQEVPYVGKHEAKS